jgi:uncharacterized protein (DUF2147 family)
MNLRDVTAAAAALWIGLFSLGVAPAAAQTKAEGVASQAFGVWRNPKGSVHIDIRPCGAYACGFVIWANADAQADAKKGGTDKLVGLQLFRELSADAAGVWRGKVFVPDLNMTFSGTAVSTDGANLKAKGCLLGRVLCKSQTWTRVESAASA